MTSFTCVVGLPSLCLQRNDRLGAGMVATPTEGFEETCSADGESTLVAFGNGKQEVVGNTGY